MGITNSLACFSGIFGPMVVGVLTENTVSAACVFRLEVDNSITWFYFNIIAQRSV